MSEDKTPVPLSPEDRAILDLECQTIAGHTCKVIVLGPPAPSVEQLRELIGSRIVSAPALTSVLGGKGDALVWAPDRGFDVSRHTAAVPGPPVDDEGLPRLVASLFEQRLPRDRPLWQIDVARMDGERIALIWRLHHAVADGTTAMRFARDLLWDEETVVPGSRPVRRRESTPDDARRRAHLAAFVKREFGESLHRSPFDGTIGTRRHIAFAIVPFQPLHDAAKEIDGATVNDAVLAVTAGGLRRWLVHHHGDPGTVRLRVPVSLHSEHDDAGNRDSFFTLPVGLDEEDPVRRLRDIHTRTQTRKHEHDAERLAEVMTDVGQASSRLERFLERLEACARSFALCISNVPGPRRPVSVLGSPVESMHTLAEIGRHHALRVAVVSAAGELHFGFTADPAIVDDLDEMARGLEAEAEALIAAAG